MVRTPDRNRSASPGVRFARLGWRPRRHAHQCPHDPHPCRAPIGAAPNHSPRPVGSVASGLCATRQVSNSSAGGRTLLPGGTTARVPLTMPVRALAMSGTLPLPLPCSFLWGPALVLLFIRTPSLFNLAQAARTFSFSFCTIRSYKSPSEGRRIRNEERHC